MGRTVSEALSRRWFPIFLAGLAGCKTLGAGATESYSLLYSCPPEHVQTIERSDLDAAASVLAVSSPPTAVPGGRAAAVIAQWHIATETTPKEPPKEVAEDPARRKVWEAHRAEVLAELDQKTAFEVRGCGHSELLLCAHTKNPKNGATYTNEVACVGNPFRQDARPMPGR